jgi:hypothetical protein
MHPTLRLALTRMPLSALLALASCGGSRVVHTGTSGSGNYAAPGPPGDPWGPHIHEAAARFSVPEAWIRAVIRQESGGHEYLNGRPTTSDAGAMGLMQIMPATYAELRDRYNLGPDPYDPHDNIMAGTGYIRELYGKYGAPGFLAAYNAGPQRLEQYLAGEGPLPNETVNYLASVAPSLQGSGPMTGPLAVYAQGGSLAAPVPHLYAARNAPPAPGATCWHDPDLAYDPSAPCQTPPPAAPPPSAPEVPIAVASAAPAAAAAPSGACWHDADRAYDPSAPCQSPPPATAVQEMAQNAARPPAAPQQIGYAPASGTTSAIALANAPPAPVPLPPYGTFQATAPAPAPVLAATAQPAPDPTHYTYAQAAPPPRLRLASAMPPPAAAHRTGGFALIAQAHAEPMPLGTYTAPDWGVQVGAFPSIQQAKQAATAARAMTPELARAAVKLPHVVKPSGQVLYRARLTNLTRLDAAHTCSRLAAHRWNCLVLPPGT